MNISVYTLQHVWIADDRGKKKKLSSPNAVLQLQ